MISKHTRWVALLASFFILFGFLFFSPKTSANPGGTAQTLNVPCGISKESNNNMSWAASCMQLSIIDRGHILLTLVQDSHTLIQKNGTSSATMEVLGGEYTLGKLDSTPVYCRDDFKCNGPAIFTGGTLSSRLNSKTNAIDNIYSAADVNGLFRGTSNAKLHLGGNGGGSTNDWGKSLFGVQVCSSGGDYVWLENDGTIGWNCVNLGDTYPGKDYVHGYIIYLDRNLDANSLSNFNITFNASSDGNTLTSVFSDGSNYDTRALTWCESAKKFVLGNCNDANPPSVSGVTPTDFFKVGTTPITIQYGNQQLSTLVKNNGVVPITNPATGAPLTPCAGSTPVPFGQKCPVAASSGGGSGGSSQIECDFGGNPLTWIVCPVVKGINTAAARMDEFINNQLEFDASNYGGTTNNGTQFFDKNTNGVNPFYTAWSSFRIIATALIVIAGLVMVASQAIGLEILDAYTIRKILPRLLIAIIGISLSWPLMSFMVGFSNTLGKDIEGLLFSPFKEAGGFSLFSTATASSASGVGGAMLLGGIGLGFLGALSFGLTALLAFLVGFLIILARNIALIMILIIAPIGIAAYILPNTQKIWKLWIDNFLGLLMVYPIVTLMISAGKIFSWSALSGVTSQTSFINSTALQIMGFVAYILPFFALPLAFRLATGTIGALAGMVNDRGRGAFDRLKKYRGGQIAKNTANLKAGSRFSPESKLTRALGGNVVNRVGSNAGAGLRGRFGFGATGAATRANNAALTMDGAARESSAFAAQMNNEGAMVALAFGNNKAKLQKLAHYQKRDKEGKLVNDLDADMAAASSIGVTRRMQVAGAEALAKSGKILHSREEADSMYDTISGGNAALRSAVKGNYQFTSRQAGRQDLGRNNAYEAIRELDMGSVGRQKPAALEHLFATRDNGTSQFDDAVAKAASPSEKQQMYDVLYAAQFNPYTTPEQQGALAQTIARHEGNTNWRQAQSNYGAKMAASRGGDASPGEAAGGPPNSPPPAQ